jgi:ketosteroid isomerase-like protein
MKNLMMLSMSILLFVTACKKNETKALSAEEQSRLVKTLDSMYSHHIEKQQADSLVNTYLADAIVLTPGEDEVKGINAIKDWYANAFEYGLRTLNYTSTSIIGDENHLIEVGKSTVGLQIGEADTLTYEEYKYMHVWVKQANGKYKLSRDMWNQNQAK